MAPETDLNNPSGSEKNKKTPLWKRVAAGGAAIASLNMLAACGDDEVNAQPESTEPVAASTLTPGNTNNTPEATPTPSQNETTIPPATETTKPVETVDELDIHTMTSTENLTDEQRDELREIFENMDEAEYYNLPAKTRLLYVSNEVDWHNESGWLNSEAIIYGHENNPDLYKYNPFEIASIDNTPEEIIMQLNFMRQTGLKPTGYNESVTPKSLRMLSSNVLLDPDLHAEGVGGQPMERLDMVLVKNKVNSDIDALIDSGSWRAILPGVEPSPGHTIGVYTEPSSGKIYDAIQLHETYTMPGENVSGHFAEGTGRHLVAVWDDEVEMWKMVDYLPDGNTSVSTK